MRILLTGGKSATALKLMKAFAGDEIILADYGDVPALSSGAYSFISLGEKNEETLAHTLLSHCLDNQIDAILPLHLFELEPIAKADVLFNEFGIEVLLPKATDIESYLTMPIDKRNWIILKNGKIIFDTDTQFALNNVLHNGQLSGAYYYSARVDHLQLNLVTI